jgi:hypothetical protein
MEPEANAADMEVPDRLLQLDRGSHRASSGQACAMEAASWLAGDRWSDHPRSVHPVIAWVARWTNDVLDDAERHQLWPLILASLDTARPRRFLLAHRLRRCAGKAIARSRGEDPRRVWECVLAEHARLTDHRPTPISVGRFESLAAHLRLRPPGEQQAR